MIGLIGARSVDVVPIKTDIYGRTVAVVRCGGCDLSHEMVRAGFARAAPYWSWAYLGTELAARRGRRDLWAQCRFTGISDPARHRRRQALAKRLRR